MNPGTFAGTPDKVAYVIAESEEVVTYAQLDRRSNQVAQLLRSRGVEPGDCIAIFMENNSYFLELTWAAQRSGLIYTAASSRLKAPELAYILQDSGASVLVTSRALASTAAEALSQSPGVRIALICGDDLEGFERYERLRDEQPAEPVEPQLAGSDMLYSSGTTGRPKGIRTPFRRKPADTPTAVYRLATRLYGLGSDSFYLSPAPLYHGAPLRFVMAALQAGATVVIMEHFDAERLLHLIERWKITHVQLVPTMFIRLLRLDEERRASFDHSSLRAVIDSSAPCPIPVKERMIEWWGPVIYEYYAGTEGNGFTAIDSAEWLLHKGSVGRAIVGTIRIIGSDGQELPAGQVGMVYFAGGGQFEYHNDPEKTAAAKDAHGWSTLGDVGYVDNDGYLYLTDRKEFTIISGGVNIYPQEAENVLSTHPEVVDVAVFGVPDDEMGESVKAIVQPRTWAKVGPELERALIDFCRASIATFKCPRSVDFEKQLPRDVTGKLFKKQLRDRYWTGTSGR